MEQRDERATDKAITRLSDIVNNNQLILLEKITVLHGNISTTSALLSAVESKLSTHMVEEDAQIESIKDILKDAIKASEEKTLAGFPNKDPLRHHDYHIEIIDSTNSKKAMFRSIVTFALSGIFWSILVLLGVALWSYFKQQVK
jgi:5'-3' exonuclease